FYALLPLSPRSTLFPYTTLFRSIVDFRVLIYRFYNQVKVEGDKLVCTAGSGSEIGISEDVFQFYKEDLARLNADMVKMEDRPDEDALRENLEDQLRQILTL